jgi:hypothetical protein
LVGGITYQHLCHTGREAHLLARGLHLVKEVGPPLEEAESGFKEPAESSVGLADLEQNVVVALLHDV